MKFLIKLFIKDYNNVENTAVREKYSVLSGVVGILCNIVLFLVKLFSGIVTGSIAIFADAFNNLSDCGSSIISIASAKLSNRSPDREHPFGHGRIEYIASLFVSFLIMYVGVELLKTSADKIIHPKAISLSPVLIFILVCTIFVKIWMYFYNKYMAEKISSLVLEATAKDSLNDSVATSVTLISAFISQFLSFPLDGIMGVLVSLFIMYGGFSLAKDTIGILLGSPADKETVKKIEETIMSEKQILGMHDLIIHDYGPGRVMASVHAEISNKEDITSAHETIDYLETKISNEMGIHMVIHMDPIKTDCEITNTLSVYIKEELEKYDSDLKFHDLRITDGEKNINVIFDVVVPADYTQEQKNRLCDHIKGKISELNPKFSTVINIDLEY